MIALRASQQWKRTYPGSAVGFLALSNVRNPEWHPDLEEEKAALERDIRARLGGLDRLAIRALPRMAAYNAYYRRFDKSYHVQFQLESVALKGKPIPRVAALVEAMFMAELHGMLLTAGHDLGAVRGDVVVEVASGVEQYTLLNGKVQTLKAGDMFMADEAGVISSILYGPDQRTRLTPGTREALFAVYAPEGIGGDAVKAQLERIRDNVRIVSPQAQLLCLEILEASWGR